MNKQSQYIYAMNNFISEVENKCGKIVDIDGNKFLYNSFLNRPIFRISNSNVFNLQLCDSGR